jgi:hypothetical protein
MREKWIRLISRIAIVILASSMLNFGMPLFPVVLAQTSVVDMRLIPSATVVSHEATFTLDIRVEPNGQETTGVQVFIDYDPSHLQVSLVVADSGSPLEIPLQTPEFDNAAGTIGLSYGTLSSGPTDPFTLATITFIAEAVEIDTNLVFSTTLPRKTIASVGGSETQNELVGATITIGAPSATATPTPEPIPSLTEMALVGLAIVFGVLTLLRLVGIRLPALPTR